MLQYIVKVSLMLNTWKDLLLVHCWLFSAKRKQTIFHTLRNFTGMLSDKIPTILLACTFTYLLPSRHPTHFTTIVTFTFKIIFSTLYKGTTKKPRVTYLKELPWFLASCHNMCGSSRWIHILKMLKRHTDNRDDRREKKGKGEWSALCPWKIWAGSCWSHWEGNAGAESKMKMAELPNKPV